MTNIKRAKVTREDFTKDIVSTLYLHWSSILSFNLLNILQNQSHNFDAKSHESSKKVR